MDQCLKFLGDYGLAWVSSSVRCRMVQEGRVVGFNGSRRVEPLLSQDELEILTPVPGQQPVTYPGGHTRIEPVVHATSD